MDLSPKKDWLLILVAAYVIQQIVWGEGWTETNIALLVCLVFAVGTGIFLRTDYGKRMEEKRLEEKKRYQEEQQKKKELTPKEERKRDRKEMRRLEREAKREEEKKKEDASSDESLSEKKE